MSTIASETRAPSSSQIPAAATGVMQTEPTSICDHTKAAPPGARLERAFQPACAKAAIRTSRRASGVTRASLGPGLGRPFARVQAGPQAHVETGAFDPADR